MIGTADDFYTYSPFGNPPPPDRQLRNQRHLPEFIDRTEVSTVLEDATSEWDKRFTSFKDGGWAAGRKHTKELIEKQAEKAVKKGPAQWFQNFFGAKDDTEAVDALLKHEFKIGDKVPESLKAELQALMQEVNDTKGLIQNFKGSDKAEEIIKLIKKSDLLSNSTEMSRNISKLVEVLRDEKPILEDSALAKLVARFGGTIDDSGIQRFDPTKLLASHVDEVGNFIKSTKNDETLIKFITKNVDHHFAARASKFMTATAKGVALKHGAMTMGARPWLAQQMSRLWNWIPPLRSLNLEPSLTSMKAEASLINEASMHADDILNSRNLKQSLSKFAGKLFSFEGTDAVREFVSANKVRIPVLSFITSLLDGQLWTDFQQGNILKGFSNIFKNMSLDGLMAWIAARGGTMAITGGISMLLGALGITLAPIWGTILAAGVGIAGAFSLGKVFDWVGSKWWSLFDGSGSQNPQMAQANPSVPAAPQVMNSEWQKKTDDLLKSMNGGLV